MFFFLIILLSLHAGLSCNRENEIATVIVIGVWEFSYASCWVQGVRRRACEVRLRVGCSEETD